MLAFTFTAMPGTLTMQLALLAFINILSGASIAGINLAIDNFGLKLAPKEEAIVYISTRNIMVAFISALAPILGGLMADYFATHSIVWRIANVEILHLHSWNFLFVIGGLLAILSLQLLKRVQEKGEVRKDVVVGEMRLAFKTKLKEN